MIAADRWTIYLISDTEGVDGSDLEPIAVRKRGDQTGPAMDDDWRRLVLGDAAIPSGSESKAAKLAAAGMGTIKKKEHDRYVVAVPLICGDRILGVLEVTRDGKYARSFKKPEVALLDALAAPVADGGGARDPAAVLARAAGRPARAA